MFQICANAGAATGIESRNGQQNGRNDHSLGVKVAHHRRCGARAVKKMAGHASDVKFRFFTQKTAGTCECTRTNFSPQGNSRREGESRRTSAFA
jgi:hypothetical protein